MIEHLRIFVCMAAFALLVYNGPRNVAPERRIWAILYFAMIVVVGYAIVIDLMRTGCPT